MLDSQNNSKVHGKNIGLFGSFNKTAEFNFEDDPSPIKNKVYDLGEDFQSQLRSRYNNDLDDSIFRDTNFMQCNIVDLNQVNIKTNKLAILKNYHIQEDDDVIMLHNYQQNEQNKNYYYTTEKQLTGVNNNQNNNNIKRGFEQTKNNKWKKFKKQQRFQRNQQQQSPIRTNLNNKLTDLKVKSLLKNIQSLKYELKFLKSHFKQQFSKNAHQLLQKQIITLYQKFNKLNYTEQSQKNQRINTLEEQLYHLKTINQQFVCQIQQMEGQLKQLVKYEQNQAESHEGQNKQMVKQMEGLIHQLNSQQNNYRLLSQQYEQISSQLQTLREKYASSNDQKQTLDKENHSLRQYVFDLQKTVEQLQQQKFKAKCFQQINKEEQLNKYFQQELVKQHEESSTKLKQLQDYFNQEMEKMSERHKQQLAKVQKMYLRKKQANRQKALEQCIQNQKTKYNELYKQTIWKVNQLQKQIQNLQQKFYQNNKRIIQKQQELQQRQKNAQNILKSKHQMEKQIKKKQKAFTQLKQHFSQKEREISQKEKNFNIKFQQLQFLKNKLKVEEQLLRYKSTQKSDFYEQTFKLKTQKYKQYNPYKSRQSRQSPIFQNIKQNYERPNQFFYRSNFDQQKRQQLLYTKINKQNGLKITDLRNNLSEYNSPMRLDLKINKSGQLLLSQKTSRYNSPINQKLIQQKSIRHQENQRHKKRKHDKSFLKQRGKINQYEIKSQQKLDAIRINCKNSNMKNIQNKLIKLKKDLEKEIVDMKT